MSDLITVQGVVLSAMPIGEYDKRIVLLTRERGKISAFAKGARRQNSPFMAAANPFVFGSFTLFEGRSSYNLNQVNVSHHFVELAARQPGIYYGYYFLELADYFGRENTDEKEMMNLLYITIKALLNARIDDRLVRCIFELRTMSIQGMMPQLFSCCCCEKKAAGEAVLFFSQEEHGILCGDCFQRMEKERLKGSGNTADPPRDTGTQPSYGRQDSGKLFYQAASIRRISQGALYAMEYIVTAPMGKLYTFTVKEDILLELEHHIHTYAARNTDKRFKSLDILEVMC